MRLPSLLLALCAVSTPSLAMECSAYEAQVFALVDEAIGFQTGGEFRKFGFGSGGPYSEWFKRMQALQNHPEAEAFYEKYDFNVTTVYSVADEYRSAKGLDAFWRDAERRITTAQRCDTAAGATTDKNLEIAFVAWAGMNCGDMIPMEEYGQALQHIDGLGKERAAAYRRQVKATIDEAATTAVACQSVKDALGR